MRKSDKYKKLENLAEEIILADEICHKSVEWWGKEIDETCEKIDKLFEKDGDDEEKEKMLARLEELIKLGEEEMESLDILEAKVDKFTKGIENIEKRKKRRKN